VTTIDLVYFNAGGGHRAAALALQESLAAQPVPWQARCVDLFERLDPRGRFERVTGFAPEAYYNKRLAKGWTLGLAQELRLLQAMIRVGHRPLVGRLESHWLRSRPDLVVSLVPNFNRALHESVLRALPGVPFAVVMTDMADHPPHFWVEPPRGQHIVCGTEHAATQALALGHAADHVHRSSGMIIRPDFYAPLALERGAELARLGLDPARPTGIVMFGGHGSNAMLGIARDLADVQLVLMCGRNRQLAARLRAEATTAPHAVVEFTTEVRRHLQLGDFFIGKPGPGSLSEAAHCGLPIVTVRNAWTMPQERFNTEWVQANGLGVVASSSKKIGPAVAELLARLPELKANIARLDNRAVFELPAILARILAANEAALAAPHGHGAVKRGT
jgi:hypothetical protein